MKTYQELKKEGAFVNNISYPVRSEFKSYYFYKKGNCIGPCDTDAIIKLALDNGFQLLTADYNENVWQLNASRILTYLKEFYTIEMENNDELFEKAKTNYYLEDRRILLLFKKCIYHEFGVENNPKKDLLFEKAWELGHSGGYDEVYNYFGDLVDLIK